MDLNFTTKSDFLNYLLNNFNLRQLTEKYFIKHFLNFYNDLLTWVFPSSFSFSQKLYHYLHDDKELKLGLCCECGNRSGYLNFKLGYRKYCCKKCMQNSEEIQTKKKQTRFQHYNVEYIFQSKDFYRKFRETMNERYGGIGNASKELKEKQKKTNKERYGDENYNNSEKTKQTCLDKYNGQGFASKELLEKQKQTCLERYGVESYSQTGWYVEKSKETCLKRYGKESYTQTEGYLKKEYETKKKNHSFNSSKIEKEFANWLTENNINFESQYRSELYPFCCDFYLNDYDLYIEIQGSWVHGRHPYNPDNEEDRLLVEKWKSKNTKFYSAAIDIWTKRDVKKREIAKENNLNYLEIFSCKLEECASIVINNLCNRNLQAVDCNRYLI